MRRDCGRPEDSVRGCGEAFFPHLALDRQAGGGLGEQEVTSYGLARHADERDEQEDTFGFDDALAQDEDAGEGGEQSGGDQDDVEEVHGDDTVLLRRILDHQQVIADAHDPVQTGERHRDEGHLIAGPEEKEQNGQRRADHVEEQCRPPASQAVYKGGRDEGADQGRSIGGHHDVADLGVGDPRFLQVETEVEEVEGVGDGPEWKEGGTDTGIPLQFGEIPLHRVLSTNERARISSGRSLVWRTW